MRIHRGALATALALAVVAAVGGSVGAEPRNVPSQARSAAPGPRLEMYEATVDAATANRLADEGYDVVSTEQVRGGVRIVLVLYPTERKAIEKQGIDLTLWTNTEGVTATGWPGSRRTRASRSSRTTTGLMAFGPTSIRSRPPTPAL